ncbi:nuclear transport factor 2 family protein [Psychroflexus salis]|nr:nuclear transport factor 2 family protein [Psychroflexus salis]
MASLFFLLQLSFAVAQQNVDQQLNQWHEAAAAANFESYFSHFTEDAYFVGTDASERWSVNDFKTFAKTHFNSAPAWEFIPVQRNIEISSDGKTAWFDEVLNSNHLGVCRGSGVLILENNQWKIQHYVLSLIVPNELAKEVAKLKNKADQLSLTELLDH